MLKDVESQIRCTRYFLDRDIPLSKRNNDFYCDILTVMSCIWFDASLQPELVNTRWVNALGREPVLSLMCILKDADFWLISQKFSSYGGFKRHLHACYPSSGLLLGPISGLIARFYSTGEGLPRIRTCLRFATRANFPEPLGLEKEAFEAWCDTCLSPWNEVDVQQEACVLREIFPRTQAILRVDDFIGRFGPGASADVRQPCLLSKYQSFKTDPMLDYVGNKVGFHPHEMPICGQGLERTGHLHFVPKWLDKLRTVTMEPCSLMFYQLGLARCMINSIQKSRWRRHIDLTKADLNADLAWLGSLDGSYATIDLSHASDSVKLELVRALFFGTALREPLLGTRSRDVEYEGRYYTPTYFAPMGSGLCFPVECAVFASIVDVIMRRHDDRRAWRVYGDDIVVPTDRYTEVCERLLELGFEVNLDKSFGEPTPGFRESCGGDFFKGENVRPVYCSRFWEGLPKKSRVKPSMIESCIDLANRLVHYKQARLRVIEALLQVRPQVYFDPSGESGIFTVGPTNYRAKSRWNEGLQREEVYVGQMKVRHTTHNPEHEGIRYFETLRAMAYSPACAERMPISISRPCRPTWSGAWKQAW